MIRLRKRRGFSLIDVALATVILALGLLGSSRFFSGVYEELSPQANGGGLRRFILAETMLKAEAEALRATQFCFPDNSNGLVKMVTEPPGAGISLVIGMPPVVRYPAASPYKMQYNYYDLSVTDQNTTIATLSLSTLRAYSGALNAKIGL